MSMPIEAREIDSTAKNLDFDFNFDACGQDLGGALRMVCTTLDWNPMSFVLRCIRLCLVNAEPVPGAELEGSLVWAKPFLPLFSFLFCCFAKAGKILKTTRGESRSACYPKS